MIISLSIVSIAFDAIKQALVDLVLLVIVTVMVIFMHSWVQLSARAFKFLTIGDVNSFDFYWDTL